MAGALRLQRVADKVRGLPMMCCEGVDQYVILNSTLDRYRVVLRESIPLTHHTFSAARIGIFSA